MATCKDCLHLEACKQWYTALPDKYHDGCEHFKPRSRFVELPCNIGDTVYTILYLKKGKPGGIIERRCTGIHISEKVLKRRSAKAYYYLTTNTEFGSTVHIPFSKIGKSVFFTYEEAKAALSRRKDDTE